MLIAGTSICLLTRRSSRFHESDSCELKYGGSIDDRYVMNELPAAVTPEQAINYLDAEDRHDLVKLIERINSGLQSHYYPNGLYTFSAKLVGNQRVETVAFKHFEKAGWLIKYVSDARDGDYYEFTARQ